MELKPGPLSKEDAAKINEALMAHMARLAEMDNALLQLVSATKSAAEATDKAFTVADVAKMIGILNPVCECGGDAAGTTHSEWCPKR